MLFGADANRALIVTSRGAADGDFGAPTELPLPEGVYGSPNITADCRTLYYTQRIPNIEWTVEVIRR